MANKINVDFLKNAVFKPQPISWFLHAQSFHYAGLQLIAKYEQGHKFGKKFISSVEIFNKAYTYKIAIYLLCHGVELLLKGIIDGAQLGVGSIKFSHSVSDMVNLLVKENILNIEEEDLNTIKIIEVYLKWFGRYYCPKPKEVDEIITEMYTNPDGQNMVTPKHSPQYPDTHEKIKILFKSLWPKDVTEASFSVPSLIFYP